MSDALRRWLTHNGGETMLAIVQGANGDRFAVADEWIGPGDCILRVPNECLLTTSAIADSDVVRELRNSGRNFGDQVLLSAFVAASRNDESRWSPYLDTLPTTAPPTPVFFDDAELRELAGTTLAARALEQREAIRNEWHQVRAVAPALNGCTERDWLTARSLVTSRAFGLRSPSGVMDSLVPMADIPNHRRPGQAEWSYDAESGTFTMVARRAFAPGESVHISYGAKGNSRLLLHYGFCLENNECDDAGLTIAGREYRVTAVEGSPGERDMIAAIAGSFGDPAEASVRGTILEACDRAISSFPTSIDDDEQLLATGDLTLNRRHSVLARLSEKRVLAAVRERWENGPTSDGFVPCAYFVHDLARHPSQ